MTAEVFADGYTAGSLIFSGVEEDGLHHVDLSHFHFNDKISNMKVTAGVEVEVHADYGKSSSHSKGVSFEDMVSLTIPGIDPKKPGSNKVKASIIIEFGKMEADAVRKWHNIRTGAIIEDRGRIKFNKANKTRVEVH